MEQANSANCPAELDEQVHASAYTTCEKAPRERLALLTEPHFVARSARCVIANAFATADIVRSHLLDGLSRIQRAWPRYDSQRQHSTVRPLVPELQMSLEISG